MTQNRCSSRLLCLLGFALQFSVACAGSHVNERASSKGPGQGKRTIKISIREDHPSAMAAWREYGLGAAATVPRLPGSVNRFDMELSGRQRLVETWQELQAQGPKGLKDPYLDQLAIVAQDGFLPEYVVVFLAAPGWTISPQQLKKLRLEAFADYAHRHLEGHQGQRHAHIEVEGESPPWGNDVGQGIEVRQTAADCANAMTLLEERARQWRARTQGLATVPLAARSRAEFVAALRLPELQARLAERGVTWVSPALGQLYSWAGFCAIETHDHATAEWELGYERTLNPLNAHALVELAHVHVKQKRWDDALSLIAKGLEFVKEPCNQAILWRKRGFIFIEQVRLPEAREAYLKSLEFDPGHPLALEELKLIDELRQKAGAADGSADAEKKLAIPGYLTARTNCQDAP